MYWWLSITKQSANYKEQLLYVNVYNLIITTKEKQSNDTAVPVHIQMLYAGGIAPLIRNHGTEVINFTPGNRDPGTHGMAGCVGPRAVMDVVDNIASYLRR